MPWNGNQVIAQFEFRYQRIQQDEMFLGLADFLGVGQTGESQAIAGGLICSARFMSHVQCYLLWPIVGDDPSQNGHCGLEGEFGKNFGQLGIVQDGGTRAQLHAGFSFFCQDRELADFGARDVIALMSAGAYSFTMASNYNSRPMPAEILIDGSEARVVRGRQSWDDLIAPEL